MDVNNYDFYVVGDALRNDFYWNVKLYSRSLQYKKAYNKQKYQNDKDAYLKQIYKCKNFIKSQMEFLANLSLDEPNPNIKTLPKYSFFLQFKFTLKKSFYSHDDEDFYIIDNPVTKEHIFKIPMMRPSGWKGNLRSTTAKINNVTEKNCDSRLIKSLFGCTDKEKKTYKKGRLIFYPTYFDNIGLEVINPHDRTTKAGTNPILYEVVPKGSSGVFSLLYIPFDRIGDDAVDKRGDSIVCYQKVSEAIKEMMTVYGFGAKTSSGYGVIDKIENGAVKINGIDLPKSEFSTFDELKMIIERVQ